MKRIPFFDVPTHQNSKVWIFEDSAPPTMVKRQQHAMKIVMYAAFFRSTGLVKAIKMEGQKTDTANWHTIKYLPEIPQKVNFRGLILHHDNASSHSARLIVEFLEQKHIKAIEHPLYSPYLAMRDFWLF